MNNRRRDRHGRKKDEVEKVNELPKPQTYPVGHPMYNQSEPKKYPIGHPLYKRPESPCRPQAEEYQHNPQLKDSRSSDPSGDRHVTRQYKRRPDTSGAGGDPNYREKNPERVYLFFGKEHYFSQFCKVDFEIDGRHFFCFEQ